MCLHDDECVISPLCSYFLGELEKCVAEPERLAQLFIKHVSLSNNFTERFFLGPKAVWPIAQVPEKIEQNFL